MLFFFGFGGSRDLRDLYGFPERGEDTRDNNFDLDGFKSDENTVKTKRPMINKKLAVMISSIIFKFQISWQLLLFISF